MGFEEIWNEYTSSEKDMFQKSVRRLLKQTFIVRDRDEDSKKAYYFVSKRSEPFSRSITISYPIYPRYAENGSERLETK